MEESYFSALVAIKEVKKKFISLVDEFLKKERVFNLRSDQVLALYYIGHRVIPIKDLTHSGIYDGSNPSYLIRSMIEKGYLSSKSCPNDMRVVHISAAEKGKECFEKLKVFFQSLEGQEGIRLD